MFGMRVDTHARIRRDRQRAAAFADSKTGVAVSHICLPLESRRSRYRGSGRELLPRDDTGQLQLPGNSLKRGRVSCADECRSRHSRAAPATVERVAAGDLGRTGGGTDSPRGARQLERLADSIRLPVSGRTAIPPAHSVCPSTAQPHRRTRSRLPIVGHTIRALESATNACGTSLPVSSSATSLVQPGAASITVVLLTSVTPAGASADVRTALPHGGYTLDFTAPAPGSLSVGWYFLPPGAHSRVSASRCWWPAEPPGSRPSGRAKSSLGRPGRAGSCSSVPDRSLRAKARFTPVGGRAVTVVKRFTLTRWPAVSGHRAWQLWAQQLPTDVDARHRRGRSLTHEVGHPNAVERAAARYGPRIVLLTLPEQASLGRHEPLSTGPTLRGT